MKQQITSFIFSLSIHLLLLVFLSIPTAHHIIFNKDSSPTIPQRNKPQLLRLVPSDNNALENQAIAIAPADTPASAPQPPPPPAHVEIATAPSIPVQDEMVEGEGVAEDESPPTHDELENNESEMLPEVIEHPLQTVSADIPELKEETQLVAENVFTETLAQLWSGKSIKTDSNNNASPQKEAAHKPKPRVMSKEERTQAAIAALLKKESKTPAQPSTRTIFEKAREAIKPTVHPRTESTHETPTGRGAPGVAGFKRLDNDMRYASYQTRISSHIASSHRVFMHHLPEMQKQKLRSMAMRGELAVALSIVINKDGTLKECAITRSSGDPFIDEIFLKFQRFIAPYPRIPDHLNIATFRISGDFHFPL